MLTNTQTSTLRAALKASDSLYSAQDAFNKRLDAMREAGFTAEMLDKKSDRIGEIREAVASAILSQEDFKTWADVTLTRKITTEDKKRVSTPRDLLIKQVDERIARLAEALSRAAKKGPNNNTPRTLKERVTIELGKLHKAVNKDATGDAPQLDNKIRSELLAAFQRALDLVK
jgi:hypothetical protein